MQKFRELAGGVAILLIGTALSVGYSSLADRMGEWVERGLHRLFH